MLKRLILASLFMPMTLLAYVSPGQPSGFVNDFAGILNSEEKISLETKLMQFEKDSGNEISVAIIKSLEDDTIEDYAVNLFSDWGIGKKDNDNGILLLIAMDERKMRIEVGYGLEGALTDIQSASIIADTIRPAFQRGDYYLGIDMAVDNMISATKGEYTVASGGGVNSINSDQVLNILTYALFALVWLASILARSKSWWAGGVVGGVLGIIAGVVFGFFYVGFTALALLVPFGLFLDFMVSRAYQRGAETGHYPWWIGGGPHGGGGLGGGFRGFGGGGSGGGGSSGDW